MSKYILLTNSKGEVLAVNADKVLAVETNCWGGDGDTSGIKSTVIVSTYTTYAREPVAIILEKLNSVNGIDPATGRRY